MLRAAALLLLAAASASGGCSGDPDQDQAPPAPPASATSHNSSAGLKIATSDWRPGDDAMKALLGLETVRLTVAGNSCVVLSDTEGRRFDVVWPAGFTAVDVSDGPSILNAQGVVVVRSGQALRAGGGYIRTDGQPCVGERAFFVQSEVPSLQE